MPGRTDQTTANQIVGQPIFFTDPLNLQQQFHIDFVRFLQIFLFTHASSFDSSDFWINFLIMVELVLLV